MSGYSLQVSEQAERSSSGETPSVEGKGTSGSQLRPREEGAAKIKMQARGLRAFFGKSEVIKGISLPFPERKVTAIIGPSGCGKSTFIRCLNRMHETFAGAIVEGDVTLGDASIYKGGLNAIAVRRHIGMVFQRPTPFPTMSIRDNVAAGLRIRIGHSPSRRETDEIVQAALERAG